MEVIKSTIHHSFNIDSVIVEEINDDGIVTVEVTIHFYDGSFEVHSYQKE